MDAMSVFWTIWGIGTVLGFVVAVVAAATDKHKSTADVGNLGGSDALAFDDDDVIILMMIIASILGSWLWLAFIIWICLLKPSETSDRSVAK